MRVLVLNCGGATLKFKLLTMPEEAVLARGMVDRFGPSASFRLCRPGHPDRVTTEEVPDHLAGIRLALAALTDDRHGIVSTLAEIDAVAHKLAHGGERYREPVRIGDEVLAELETMSALVPLHNPPSIRGVRAVADLLPHTPQFGSFETSFHQTVPAHAWMYGLPRSWYEDHHVRKYGFHSASHRYVAHRVRAPRLISCHLGSGTSVCAIREGRSLDISSGLTPQSGTLMSTRPGDFDPFVVTYLMRKLGGTPEAMEQALTRESGLLGISGVSGDLREVEAAAAGGHGRAQLAIEAFCYHVRRYVGSSYVELGGLDALVFTGGIGENSPRIRAGVCSPLSHLGVELDEQSNRLRGQDGLISSAASPVRVEVVVADEEIMVARDACELIARV